MIEKEYPLFLSHHKEHLACIKKMGGLIAAVENRGSMLSEEMLSFLCNWWDRHVINSDMKYARYVSARSKPPILSHRRCPLFSA